MPKVKFLESAVYDFDPKDAAMGMKVALHNLKFSGKGNGIRPKMFAIGMVTDGSAKAEINGIIYKMVKGSFFIISPLQYFNIIECKSALTIRNLSSNIDFFIKTVLSGDFVEMGQLIFLFRNPVLQLTEDNSAQINRIFDDLALQISRKSVLNKALFIRNSMERFALEIQELVSTLSGQTESGDISEIRKAGHLKKLLLLMTEHFQEHHNVGYYVKKIGLSEQYINRITNEYLHCSAKDIIDKLLITNGRIMINSHQMPLQEIASTLNFMNLSSFSRFFKNKTGLAPSYFL